MKKSVQASSKQLHIRRQTVRALQAKEIAAAAGGVRVTHASIDPCHD